MKYEIKEMEDTEKLEILASSEEIGIVETCRKYRVSTGTFYDHKEEDSLKVNYDNKSEEFKQVEEENRVLRKLLGNKEIELEVQRELLKKKFGTSDPRKI